MFVYSKEWIRAGGHWDHDSWDCDSTSDSKAGSARVCSSHINLSCLSNFEKREVSRRTMTTTRPRPRGERYGAAVGRGGCYYDDSTKYYGESTARPVGLA
ncbi:hypothetical protein EVAR_36195_1 [Eumeta japonica]|uniref:Uncharacterized protein n=1 Tax=Eumeta variegata TaxID=151549 RepID=A0A4C1VTB5_EUMVA|nr:hypothetical protein EVAR_36195_1 [Eumeta japonica]